MVRFTAVIQQFDEKGEKTGWRYIEIPAAVAMQLLPGNKKSFRVKGQLDDYAIEKTSLLPMGEGIFIIPIGAAIRKALWKSTWDTLKVQLELDTRDIEMPADFADCLEDAPEAKTQFYKQPPSHQKYYIKWIDGAKTIETRSKRIAKAIEGLAKEWDYGQMIRANKKQD